MLSVLSDIRGFTNWHPVGRVRRADFAANRKVALSICDARLPAWWLTSPKMVNIDEVRKSRPRHSPSFALSLTDQFQIHAPPPIPHHLYSIIARFAVRRSVRIIHPGPPSGAHAQAIQGGRLRLVSAGFACRA